jgi:hypothetical protein
MNICEMEGFIKLTTSDGKSLLGCEDRCSGATEEMSSGVSQVALHVLAGGDRIFILFHLQQFLPGHQTSAKANIPQT